jgi:hypothetical protein
LLWGGTAALITGRAGVIPPTSWRSDALPIAPCSSVCGAHLLRSCGAIVLCRSPPSAARPSLFEGPSGRAEFSYRFFSPPKKSRDEVRGLNWYKNIEEPTDLKTILLYVRSKRYLYVWTLHSYVWSYPHYVWR